MNKEIIKALIKDYDLPIVFYEEPYFSHFKTLYEPLFSIEHKIKLMEETLKTVPVQDFLSMYRKISEKIINQVGSNPAYQEFNNYVLEKKYILPQTGFAQTQRLYSGEKDSNEIICSVDLIKANFAVLKAFDPKIFNEANTYQDFFKQFSDSEYLIGSKKIRQVIFGNLNPKRQQTLQRYYMSWVKHYLTTLGLKEEDVLLASSDELVFKTKDMDKAKQIVDEAFQQDETMILSSDYRTSFFNLEKVHEKHDFYVKKYLNENNKIEFKNVPSHFLAQVVRYYLKQEPHVNDRKFIYEGKMATYDEPLFNESKE